jgi:hypothetical protein
VNIHRQKSCLCTFHKCVCGNGGAAPHILTSVLVRDERSVSQPSLFTHITDRQPLTRYALITAFLRFANIVKFSKKRNRYCLCLESKHHFSVLYPVSWSPHYLRSASSLYWGTGLKEKEFWKILFVGTRSQISTVPRFYGTDSEGGLMKKKKIVEYIYRELNNFHINKIQQDATVCRCLFTEKSLYMFQVSIAPIIRST